VTVLTILMLFAAGVGGGMLSGLIGGAALVTFPALLAAGLPPVNAAVSNLFSLMPANAAVVYAERALLPRADRSVFVLVASMAIGSAIGAALLLLTPGRTFEILVPLLLGFATLLLAFSAQLSAWFRARSLRLAGAEPGFGSTVKPMLPVAIYGGYFGAGLGVIILGILSVAIRGDYRSANVLKNVLIGVNTSVSGLVFISNGAVYWAPTMTMMAGAAVGGLIAGRLARVVPARAMRVAVVVMGALLTVTYAWRYWF
jgi:uncharacterized membrane protein YfcA